MRRNKEPKHSNHGPTQSYRGYVREHLDRIESKIAFGHPHELIRQELNEAGFEASLLTFRDALSRARRWRDGRSSAFKSIPAAAPTNKASDGAQVKPLLNSTTRHAGSLVDADRYFKAPSLFKPKGTSNEKT